MSKDPAVLFYTSDFLSGTALLNFEQKGKYIHLLCIQHQSGFIPVDFMNQLCAENCPVRAKFRLCEDGHYRNDRMTAEAEKRKNYCKSRSDNRKKNKTSEKDMLQHMSNHMLGHMENENENDNININKDKERGVGKGKGKGIVNFCIGPSFEEVWNLYDHKVSRKDAEKAWNKLSVNERESAIAKIPLYLSSLKDRKFQAHLSRWLNGRRWEDEYKPIVKPLTRSFKDEHDLAAFLAVRPDGV